MDISAYFKSVLEQDSAPIVICDTRHIIIYMNPAAVQSNEKYGGAALIGKNLLDCHSRDSCEKILMALDWFAKSAQNNIIYTSRSDKENKDIYMVALRDDSQALIGYYEKHEYRDRERRERYAMT